jgi:hypothetical protein
MTNHFLKRNPDSEPVCACGYRPEILDAPAPVGKLWKAKTAVLDHVKALTEATPEQAVTRYARDVLGIELAPWQRKALERSPEAPFRGRHAVKYPRAGVRQTEDGRWLVTLWDGDNIVHVIDEEDRTHPDAYAAFAQGWLTIGACWQAGTNLNGMANA